MIFFQHFIRQIYLVMTIVCDHWFIRIFKKHWKKYKNWFKFYWLSSLHLLECRYKEGLPLTDMWYINGRVESLPLTDMRYINGWVESIVLRRKARDFSVMRTGKWRKQAFILSRINFLKICQTRISKVIGLEIDRIITVLKIQVPGYTGWYHCLAALTNTDGLWRKNRETLRHSSYRQTGRQPGECISDTGYVSDNRRIHRAGIYNRRKSSDADEWAYRQRDWAESEKSYGYVKAWYQAHSNAAGRYGDIREAERAQIAFLVGVIITWC